jgi:hypothetical protein
MAKMRAARGEKKKMNRPHKTPRLKPVITSQINTPKCTSAKRTNISR